VATFSPFAGVRYRAHDLSAVIAPPYDVISEAERVGLEAADPHNAVRLELPQPDGATDRYTAAAERLAGWLGEGGPLRADDEPGFYVYRMGYTDEGGRPRTTTGVVGALGLEPTADGDVLPHERTTPKAKSDRLDLIRATGANLSPVWGLSLATGLSDACRPAGAPTATATDGEGFTHELWPVTEPAAVAAIAAAVGSAPVVIADGHHRYEVALANQAEQRAAHGESGGPWDAVMTFVVELRADQLTVAAIHRLVAGLPDGFDVAAALGQWFEAVGTATVDSQLTSAMIDAGALGLLRGDANEAVLLRPLPATVAAADNDVDSARLDVALAGLPAHDLTYQHGIRSVEAAVRSGQAQAGILLRPATVAQIAEVADARDRMPPKTTFFTPKPATGLVFRRAR
jgi:uncharacterized protein (DUF1015 family)